MKLFAAFFSFFCLSLLHGVEAKADTFDSSGHYVTYDHAKRIEGRSPALSKHRVVSSEFNKWVPWPYVASQEFQFVPSKTYYFGASRFFHVASAKDFNIHSGLSPPVQFVS